MKVKEIREKIEQQRRKVNYGERPRVPVYHLTKDGDNIPAMATAIHGSKIGPRLVLIEGDFLEGRRERWVAASTLTLQSEYGS